MSPCSLGGVVIPPQHMEDGVLEAVLFSMGRTMTQEEVKQLMQRTVQQVAGTLSLDLDRAEHLLMHCKWNVDMLIQRYTDDPDSLVLAAGLKIRNPQPDPGPVSQCPVCLSQSKESDPPPMLCCMHYCCRVSVNLYTNSCQIVQNLCSPTFSFHQSCWQEYLTARIEQNLVMNCDCPITDCRAQPTSKFFHNLLTDKDTIAKVCTLPTRTPWWRDASLNVSLPVAFSPYSMKTLFCGVLWSAALTWRGAPTLRAVIRSCVKRTLAAWARAPSAAGPPVSAVTSQRWSDVRLHKRNTTVISGHVFRI